LIKPSTILITVLLLFLGVLSHAQRFGGNPSSLKWKQLESDKIKIIFPSYRESDAKRIASVIFDISQDSIGKLGPTNNKIPIVLQTLPLVSNGYVGLGPWRSEFYMNPLQNSLDLGSTSWVDNLSTHEFRHVHQYSNFRTGISKWLYLFAGQEGQALANAASIPDWFFEGDAVYAETKYLSQGRGRLPYFFDTYNSLWNAGKKYSYQKLRNGSLKDVVPDHYQLGYMLVGHGINNYGNGFWGKVTHDAARFRGLVYPFQKAVKRHAGVNYRQFVNQTFNEFKSQFPLNENINNELAYTKSNIRRVVDYLFPTWYSKDTVLALRKPYNQLPHWVLLNKNSSKRIGLKFIGIDDYFNYKKGKIIYTGYSTDARWDWREFNDVYVYNLRDGSTDRITKNQRLFSPDFSNDEQEMVAIEMPKKGGSILQFWDLQTKKNVSTAVHPQSLTLSFPVFGRTDEEVFVIARKPDGASAVLIYSKLDHSFKELFPFVNAPIAFLKYRDQQLIFTITQSGKNEIWLYDLVQNQLNKLSSSNTGSYGGDLVDQKLIYSRPTAEGDQLFIGDISNLKYSSDPFSPVQTVYQVKFSGEEISNKLFDSAYTISNYKGTESLINIHSWRPYYEQPNWSFTMYSQNILNTLETNVQYVFNENESSHQFGAYATYGAWFPWIVGGTNYTFNRNFTDSISHLKWNEWNGNLGLRVPLSRNTGRFFRTLDVSSTFNNVFYQYNVKSIPSKKDKYVPYLHMQLFASILSQQAKQQINPRFGWTFNIQHRTSIGNIDAHQTFLGSRVYLPGFMRTHSLSISAAYQQRDTLRQYVYTNNLAMARGYESFNYPKMWRVSFNYHFPIVYPDFGVANIVYFRRIRGNIFYDDLHLKSLRTGKIIQLRSTGVEIHFDTKWWNQQPVSFGVRYSRLLDTKKFNNPPNANHWEFIMPVNLIQN